MYAQQTDTVAATIPSGQALSAALTPNGAIPVGIQMDAAWDAAVLTFQVSTDGATYQNAYTNAGAEISVTAAAGHYIVLPPTLLPGARFLKIRSGTGASPVNQSADRALVLVLRGQA